MTEKALIELAVPVLLQLNDGATDLRPQAEIRDNEYNLLTTLDLSHSASGLYVPGAAYTMPDETFICITYIVYTDVPHNNESAIYQRSFDVFLQVDPVADIFTRIVEDTMTFEQLQRILLARAAGKADGGGTTSINFRDQADTKDRITMTVDDVGDRTSVIVDGT